MVTVVFYPSKIVTCVEKGESLLDVALRSNITIRHACGGNCACTTCKVVILSGNQHISRPEESESLRLVLGRRHPPDPTLRLACQTDVISESGVVEVMVPVYADPQS